MSVEKYLIAVEAADVPAEGMVDVVTRRLIEQGKHAGEAMVGLTVDAVLEPLTGTPRMLAIVSVWLDRDLIADPVDLLDGLTGSPSVSTSTWRMTEIVFRAPTDREEQVDAHQRIKLIGSAFRRDDFEVEAFFEYWRTTHAPISASVPGGRGYVVSRAMEATGERAADGVDAFIELWWPDRATFDSAGNSPEQAAAWTDVQNYAKTTGEFWITHEHVVIAPPPTGPGLLEGDA